MSHPFPRKLRRTPPRCTRAAGPRWCRDRRRNSADKGRPDKGKLRSRTRSPSGCRNRPAQAGARAVALGCCRQDRLGRYRPAGRDGRGERRQARRAPRRRGAKRKGHGRAATASCLDSAPRRLNTALRPAGADRVGNYCCWRAQESKWRIAASVAADIPPIVLSTTTLGDPVMLAVFCWIVFSLMLLMVIPDRWHARRILHAPTTRVPTVLPRTAGLTEVYVKAR